MMSLSLSNRRARNASMIADHASMSRASTACCTSLGRLAVARSRRCWPILLAHARGCGVWGRPHPVVEPGKPEVRDRRHVYQHFRQRDEHDRQHQQLARQAEAEWRLGQCRHTRRIEIGLGLQQLASRPGVKAPAMIAPTGYSIAARLLT